jgi:uncharacterized protein (TIGR02996 family)
MREDAAFLEAIVADPTDEAVRAVYADWLQERGDVRAEYLRLEEEQRSLTDDWPLTGEPLERARRVAVRLGELQRDIPGFHDWWCAVERGLPIPDPLAGPMNATATCDPGCCGFEAYLPQEPLLAEWVAEADPEKTRQTLQAVDDLLARVVETGLPAATRRFTGGQIWRVTAEETAHVLREYKRLLEPLVLRPPEPVRPRRRRR